MGGDLVVNRMDCDILVSGFELQSRYHDYFCTDILEKIMERLLVK